MAGISERESGARSAERTRAAHGDELAIGIGANHLLKGGLLGFRQRAVAQAGDVRALDVGTEAFVHSTAHPDAIARNEFEVRAGVHIDRIVPVLYKQISVVPSVISDGSFEGHRRVLAGFGVGKSGRGMQRGQGRGLCGYRSIDRCEEDGGGDTNTFHRVTARSPLWSSEPDGPHSCLPASVHFARRSFWIVKRAGTTRENIFPYRTLTKVFGNNTFGVCALGFRLLPMAPGAAIGDGTTSGNVETLEAPASGTLAGPPNSPAKDDG